MSTTIVQQFGFEAELTCVEVIDEVVEHFLSNGNWPEFSKKSDSINIALNKEMVCTNSSGSLVVLLRGIIFSKYWLAFESIFAELWSRISTGGIERHDTFQISLSGKVPGHFEKLLFEILVRSNWYGHSIELKAGDSIYISLPIWHTMAKQYANFETGISSLVDAWRITSPLSHISNRIERSSRDMYADAFSSFSFEIERSLQSRLYLSKHLPTSYFWCISDQFRQADISLKNQAPIAALVLYMASIEAALSLFHSGIDKLFNMINAEKAINRIDSVLLDKIDYGRVIRNSIHPGKYRNSNSMVSLSQILDLREAIINTIIQLQKFHPYTP